jgi:hypothetical protein
MVREVISGVGADAKRVDLNDSKKVTERVRKLQREAKIQNATDGTYGQANQLQDLASGASTEMPQAVVGSTPAPRTIASSIRMSPLDQMSENPGPITDGAPGNTPGRQPEELPGPIDGPDNNAILARAMFMMDPTPMNRRLLESFLQEGR